MSIQRIYTLLRKYRHYGCTPGEQAELEYWYAGFDEEAECIPAIPKEKLDALYSRIEKKVTRKNAVRRLRLYMFRLTGAAAVLLFGWLGSYYWEITPPERNRLEEQIIPGYPQAELILADGSKIVLDSNSVVKNSNGLPIKVNTRPELDYTLVASSALPGEINTISVPLGGEYGVILSDGTKVWLNSGSSLIYPVAFGKESRVVELAGEAYFKVTKSRTPFIVRTNGISIKVLGTSFNVSAYAEDRHVMATLVEGQVVVHTSGGEQEYVMQPGHMLSYEKESRQVAVEECDPELYTSWINGKFKFRDMRLEDIMTKLNRWYNCEFFYQNPGLKELRFTGAAEKDRPVNYLLEMIETLTDVCFEIHGKTVVLKQR